MERERVSNNKSWSRNTYYRYESRCLDCSVVTRSSCAVGSTTEDIIKSNQIQIGTCIYCRHEDARIVYFWTRPCSD